MELMEDVDPANYFGKTIEVERFKAIGSLAIQGEFIDLGVSYWRQADR